jgi:translation initiation factor IF-2
MGHRPNFVSEDALEEQLAESLAEKVGEEQITRAPVITVMGHVDHGKTSLLDYIRKSTVASHEAGGITQHIGAYHVDTNHGMVSFLDTPGHAAFSAMRSRGAKATDVIVLVVAGDDGVKPQTEEAVKHAKAAGVPLVVAVNKMDKEGADPDRVKNELSALEVIPDDWGGDTQFIPVSAHTGDGIDKLLEAILLQAELMELTAYTDVPGQGVVVESRLDKGRGAVASVLVQNGTLRTGDIVLVGKEYGRVRALVDENGVNTKTAGPSIPVEILGLTGVPDAGDEFVVLPDEKKAKEVAEFRRTRLKDTMQAQQQASLVDNMFAGIGKPNMSTFNIILKTDVRGTLEALTASLVAMNTDEVQVKVVSSGVGGISENDVHLAATSKAMIIGFNVRADKTAKEIIDNENLQLRYYSVIYNVIDDVKAIMGGMLSPEIREEILGVAEVRDVFTSPKFGLIAGSMVIEGTIYRSKPIRVLREDVVIYEGELESLRRFKDDANEVRNGVECGIGVKNYTDVKVGDKIEVYQTTEIARSL